MKITRTSILSGKTRTMDIPIRPEDFKAWGAGATIQPVAGYLTADEREFIMTGITADEWEATFGLGEDEDLFDE